jgi:polyvinyl alcohol dehydrogenase (cytochrome)
MPFKSTLFCAAALLLAVGCGGSDGEESRNGGGAPETATWPVWGANLHNTHYARLEKTVGRKNVGRLELKWVFRTGGNVSAFPTTTDELLYFPDWGRQIGLLNVPGKMYALDRETGEEVWSRFITEYNGGVLGNSISRSSPAIYRDSIVFGDVLNPALAILGTSGATLYAADRFTGDLIWSTRLDDHPASQVTQSPVVADGVVYVGVSSLENVFAGLGIGPLRPPCCNFRGSMLALDAETGTILWKTYTTPDNGGALDRFSGVSVWGSSPCVDRERNRVYVATGQNYKVPEALEACLREATDIDDPERRMNEEEACHVEHGSADNHFDSILALDLDTGVIEWSKGTRGFDAWTLACGGELGVIPSLPAYPPECPDPEGPDYDFAQAPMLFTTPSGRELLGVGQKSGVFWALDPDRGGDLVWATKVGPGSKSGGHMFGAATDGKRIFVQTTNLDHLETELADGTVVNGGFWSALDAETGDILWQTPDPASFLPLEGNLGNPYIGTGLGPGFFGAPQGPLTLANGVVYAGSMDMEGHMYAMDQATGGILWSFESGGSVCAAPTVVDGVLYWGSGYRSAFTNDRIYAFSLPD